MSRLKNKISERYLSIYNNDQDVIILEYHYLKLEEAYKYQGGNIILHYAKLVGGIIGTILSVSWILHIVLYSLEKAIRDWTYIDIFLNNMLILASAAAPFLATFLYIIFALYLFACVIKGNQKLGMRVFFITLHPLK